jgi:hypothetical protein
MLARWLGFDLLAHAAFGAGPNPFSSAVVAWPLIAGMDLLRRGYCVTVNRKAIASRELAQAAPPWWIVCPSGSSFGRDSHERCRSAKVRGSTATLKSRRKTTNRIST